MSTGSEGGKLRPRRRFRARGAFHTSYGYYDGGYGGGGYYAGGPYYAAGDCRLRRERFWDGYGWRVRRVQVCY